MNVGEGDWVGVFLHDPSKNPTQPLVRVPAQRYPGKRATDRDNQCDSKAPLV